MIKALLQDKKFWAALVGLVMVVVSAVNPEFKLDEAALVAAIVMFISYVLSVGIDPGDPSVGVLKGFLASRKFWLLLVGITVVLFDAFGVVLPEGITPDQLAGMLYMVGALIAGIGLNDSVPFRKG
ncbi:MAG: hypothetical protein KJ556_20550 [Gammaproteobacteria bacterium]|nr:hypothetical protein [Gammaproteobacteria bacterium]